MNAAQTFTQSMGFVIFFLVVTLLFSMAFGEKVTSMYLVLVLLGMAMTNADIFEDIVRRYARP